MASRPAPQSQVGKTSDFFALVFPLFVKSVAPILRKPLFLKSLDRVKSLYPDTGLQTLGNDFCIFRRSFTRDIGRGTALSDAITGAQSFNSEVFLFPNLAREPACPFSPITLFSSPQQFLNPALFFFANFPWQGHNVRGVPKEP